MEQSIYQIAEVQIVYHSQKRNSQSIAITKAEDAYNLFLDSWDQGRLGFLEESKILLLNRANKVLGICPISMGGVSGTVVDPKVVFVAAIKAGASGLIIAHNHPSGNLKPSQQDLHLTRKLREGGRLLDIEVLDHLIVTEEGYYSFADEGVL